MSKYKHRVRLFMNGPFNKIDVPRLEVNRISIDKLKVGGEYVRFNLDLNNPGPDLARLLNRLRRDR